MHNFLYQNCRLPNNKKNDVIFMIAFIITIVSGLVQTSADLVSQPYDALMFVPCTHPHTHTHIHKGIGALNQYGI